MKTWQKVSIGIAGSMLLIAALAFWAVMGLRKTLYPPAPPMPAIVSQSMPEILSQLESVLSTNAPSVLADLQPGISPGDIAKLETQYHIQLPDEIKAIYEWHNGSVNNTNRMSVFVPIHRFLPLEEALAERTASTIPEKSPLMLRVVYRIFVGHRDSWVCLFSDGAGDGYWFDLKRKPAEGAIFSSFSEDTSYTFFPSAKNLMAGVAACYEEGAFHFKKDSSPPQLEEDFNQSQKIWNRFGASK